jgi:alkylation response protein AidB-like acyl-CoA dehydrogenase
MNLNLPEETLALKDMFARLFEAESSSERVRAAEEAGFDRNLWKLLCELGAPLLRNSIEQHGSGLSLLDATVMMEEAGRRLATVPLAESIIACQLLGAFPTVEASSLLEAVSRGEKVVTLALRPFAGAERQLVPGAGVADAVVALQGDRLVLQAGSAGSETPQTLSANAAAWFTASTDATVLASGADAVRAFEAGIEEWKVLSAAALIGLGDQALEMAAAYAGERVAFGQLIGTFQGISHPLADCVIDIDAGRTFLLWLLSELANGDQTAAAAGIDQLWWWANRAATKAVAKGLHTFGGYGLTNEYDAQLYHRRAKAVGLLLGDPELALERAGRRQFLGETASLPIPGEIALDFTLPEHCLALQQETRDFFEGILTPELRAHAHHSFEGHDWGVSKALGEARLLFPDWPEEWGGRNVSHEVARASRDVWDEFGWTINPQGTTDMVGKIVQSFGKDELKNMVLPRMGRGEITAALGYTEPSGGSDVFAARTRAVRDGDDWIINGQKMFTSGAEWASYVLLIARTDPDAPKHKGVTLFLVPLDAAGVEIHPVYTFMDERSNATFYSDVRIPDLYRLGEVNGGVKVLAAALQMEQGALPYFLNQRRMVTAATEWARTTERNGAPAIQDNRVLARLAQADAHARIGKALGAWVGWVTSQGLPDRAYGPAAKVFITEGFIADSADLLDLTAPDSLLRGREGLGIIEEGYRHSAATTIYAGTSEVLRSMVGERRLGLPRSRA